MTSIISNRYKGPYEIPEFSAEILASSCIRIESHCRNETIPAEIQLHQVFGFISRMGRTRIFNLSQAMNPSSVRSTFLYLTHHA